MEEGSRETEVREEDERFMRLALQEARLAAEEGEVPIGAVVVCDGEVISSAHNRRELDHDPSAHAEFRAMTEAAQNAWTLAAIGLHGLRDARALPHVRRPHGEFPHRPLRLWGA
jgi:tRNA(Arg) A34 adenosine deaminase TadA